MRHEIFFVVLLCVALLVSGCLEGVMRDTNTLDSLLDTIDGLAVANAASAPVNPYATPIHIGLAGITAVLEALRRKEKAGRKHAEQELNNNNHNKAS